MSRTASSAEPVSIVVPAELQGPLLDFLNAYQQVPRNVSSPQQLDDIEQQLAKASDNLFSATMQTITQETVTFREPSRTRLGSLVPSWLRLLCQPKAFKNQGRRTVSVTVPWLGHLHPSGLLQPQVRPRPTSRAQRLLPRPGMPWDLRSLQSHLGQSRRPDRCLVR